jgi:lipopolysaccharide transport system permease protein
MRHDKPVLRHRFLFEQMVRRELRQKYKGSALGVAWYLINPLVLMGAYALVFKVLLDVADIPDYPVFLLAGLIVWVFFSQSLLAAAPSLVLNAPLVRKVRFPRETIPASVATVQLVTFLAMLLLLLPVALIVRDSFDPALLLLPVVIAFLFCLVLGLSMLVAILHAHFRDVEPVLAAGLLPWFFLTPLFLPVDDLPGIREHQLIGDLLEWANPIAPFVESVRTILWRGEVPGAGHLVYVAAAGVIALAFGAFVFRRMERDLAVVL